ncbi:MAG: hypothetical protein WC695_00015 [Candidatus Omnitrophota bacterium]
MRRIHAALLFMVSLLSVSVYAVVFGAEGQSDPLVGEWNCVRASAGAITPLKFFEFKDNGSVNVIVGDCKGYGGTYELSGDETVAIAGFQDVELRGDKPMDESTKGIAREILLEAEGNYEYSLSPTGKQMTLIGKRGAEFEFEKTE